VGPRSDLEAVVKRKITSPCQDSTTPVIQPVVQRYTTELILFRWWNNRDMNIRRFVEDGVSNTKDDVMSKTVVYLENRGESSVIFFSVEENIRIYQSGFPSSKIDPGGFVMDSRICRETKEIRVKESESAFY
jgi:hypothetical protein